MSRLQSAHCTFRHRNSCRCWYTAQSVVYISHLKHNSSHWETC